MHPILLDFGTISIFGREIPIMIGSWGFMMALGVLIGMVVFIRLSRPLYPDAPLVDMYFISIIVGVAGSKLGNLFVFLPDLLAGRRAFMGVLTGGGVWLTGAIAGIGCFWVMCRINRVSMGVLSNPLVIAIPVGHAIGRLGCFLGGCCFGSECSLPWAVTYTSEFAASFNGTPLNSPRHPSQIYEFLAEILNALLLYFIWRRSPKPWTTPPIWFALYGIQRFLLEFARADARGQYGLFSTSQWISLVMAAAAIAFIVYRARRTPEPAAEPIEEPKRRPKRKS